MKSCWYQNWNPRKGNLLDTEQGKILWRLVEPVKNLSCIDLGCGNKNASVLFENYTGVDLPEFDVYNSDLKFIREYDAVLMNALIDVMEFPLSVLLDVLNHSKMYVVIHRQEIATRASVEKRPSYGGWTWHSKITPQGMTGALAMSGFKVIKKVSCKFPNWNNGGNSFLLKKI